jgi:glutamyl-tRNA synthetase
VSQDASNPRTRFAPSPTGRLHLGNARVALINWLAARKAGGRFLLRLDDTDEERSTEAHARAIEEDLRWLGLEWDESARQSERLDRYEAAAERLREDGRLYPCYETAEELSLKRKARLQAGLPPIYDRAALALDTADRQRLEAQGRRAHWRFKLEHQAIEWDDLVRGAQHFEGANLSDPVLLREDGRPLYTLSSVVDDIELGVSEVLRGEDHVANTAVQVQLFEALGGAVPRFGHLPLLTDVAGKGLSKRLGSLSVAAQREGGIEAMTINSYLAKLGTPDPIEPRLALADLVAEFDLGRFGRASPKFDPAELERLNAQLVHRLPFEAVASRLSGLDETLWAAIQPNLSRVEEASEWLAICRGEITPAEGHDSYLAEAARLLPPEPWDEATWSAWTGALKKATGRKGRELFQPLRLALTGRDHGPELKSLLPLIGRERAEARLRGESR